MTGYELEKRTQDLYSKYKAPSDKHIQRAQLSREDLYKAIDHSTTGQKALILFLAQTGLSRSDIEDIKVPQGFFEQLEQTKLKDAPEFPKLLFPCSIIFYKR